MSLTDEKIEEAIYKITRVVYEKLGESADRRLVEGLVSDIFGALQPMLSSKENSTPVLENSSAEISGTPQRFVVSVFGLDRPGIVAGVASMLGEANCSIVDINQTVVQSKFAMIMIADASRANKDVTQLREIFRNLGSRLGVRIYLQREDIFHAMHRV
jgi:ACT domain-containing protein